MSLQTPIEQAILKYSNWKSNDPDDTDASSFLQYEVITEKQHDDDLQAVANGGGNDAEGILEKISACTKNHPDAEGQSHHTGDIHVRRLSRKPSDRLGVLALHESLEARCTAADRDGIGSGGGVCREREVIYYDCFLELTRIISIDCPERGDLLLALRSESAETQNSYDALFEHAV